MLWLIWIVSLVLLALWSAAGWGLRALLTHGPDWLDTLPAWIQTLPTPAVLERWLPQWQELLLAAAAAAHTVLGWFGSAGVVIVWVVWALGTASVLGLALLLSWAVRALPKAAAPAPAQPA